MDMGRWPKYTAQGLQGGNGKRTRSVRRLHQTLPQLLGLGHDLWRVSERVDLVDLFVDVPDQGVHGPGGEQEAVGTGAVREGELPEEGGVRHSRREVQGEFQGVFPGGIG